MPEPALTPAPSAIIFDLADAAATERLGARLAAALPRADSSAAPAPPPLRTTSAPPAGAQPQFIAGPPACALPPLVAHLRGDLGAGKTTLVRGFLRSLGWTGAVRSPSYTLLEPYALDDSTAVHVDLYRLNAPSDLDDLGLRDYLAPGHVVLIEWPEKGGAHTPPADLLIAMDYEGAARRARVSAPSATGMQWLDRVRIA